MVQYGSFAADRAGPVAPEDTWAEMRDASEELAPKRSKRNVIYVAAGLISVFVIVYASIALVHGYDAKSAEAGVETVLPLHSSPVSTSETSLKSGAVHQQAHQRLHLKTIMASPAIHWAQNYLIEQVAGWARTHPTKPGHDGMLMILKKEPAKYKAIVQSKVISKLSQVEHCDVHNVCESNPVAEEIRSKVCPSGAPCPQQVLAAITKTALWAAKIATDGAFHGMAVQMDHPPPAPLQHYGPGPDSAGPSESRSPPPPGGAWQTPGANTAW